VGGFTSSAELPGSGNDPRRIQAAGWSDWFSVGISNAGIMLEPSRGGGEGPELGKACVAGPSGTFLVGSDTYGRKLESQAIRLDQIEADGRVTDGWAIGVSRISPQDRSWVWLEGMAGGPGEPVLLAGHFSSRAYFARTDGSEVVLQGGALGMYAAAFDWEPNGRGLGLRWAVGSTGTCRAAAKAAAVLSDGSALVCGRFAKGALRVGPEQVAGLGGWDGFVLKLRPDGEVAWLLGLGGPGNDGCMGITQDGDGGFVVAGYAEGPVQLRGRGPRTVDLAGHGGRDVLSAGFDSEGALLWARLDGGPGQDIGHAVARGPGGVFALTGWFEQRAVFGEGAVGEFWVQSAGDRDVFVLAFSVD